MYRYIVAIVLSLMIALPAAAGAAEKKGKDQYWGNLKGKMQGITPRKQTNVTTAVGGVRGAKDDSADSVYWKGREHAEVNEEELLKFNSAVDLAMNGENDKAIAALDEFLKAYPDSALRLDALDAMAALKEAPKAEPAKEAAPAAAQAEPAKEAAPAVAPVGPAKEAAPAAAPAEPAK